MHSEKVPRPLDQVLDEIQARITVILGPSDGTEVDQFLLERRIEEQTETDPRSPG